MNLKAIKAAVANARESARREARRNAPYVKSRGAFLSANEGQLVNSADCYDWDGTKRGLLEFAERCKAKLAPGAAISDICIEGGFDSSEYAQWLFDSNYDYEPWASSWCVTVYKDGQWLEQPTGEAA